MRAKQTQVDTSFFFKNDSLAYCFYLTEMDGVNRNNKLGITKRHYRYRARAIEWHSDIISIIMSDNDPKYTDLRNKAIDISNSLYSEMVGEKYDNKTYKVWYKLFL